MLASDAGGAHAISAANVTFDDNAAGTFAGAARLGLGHRSSKPVDYNSGADLMPSPAPAGWSSPAPPARPA